MKPCKGFKKIVWFSLTGLAKVIIQATDKPVKIKLLTISQGIKGNKTIFQSLK